MASVSAALTVLGCFDGDEDLSLTEIHRRTGITKSRILRLAGTLELHGFIAIDPARKRYRLGPTLFRLGHGLQRRYSDVAEVLRPFLERLARDSGDTAFFSVVRGEGRLCVASVEPETSVRFTVPTGVIRPLYAGASGKVLLAFGAEPLRRAVLSAPRLEPLTAGTRTDPARLAAEIEEIRRSGHAVSQGEAQPDSFAIAVPVMEAGAEPYGSLTIAGPVSRASETRMASLLALLHGAAPEILRSLQFVHGTARGDGPMTATASGRGR